MSRYFSRFGLLILSALSSMAAAHAQTSGASTQVPDRAQVNGARAYTTITALNVTPLSNGVQISVAADGILQYRSTGTFGSRMEISFPDARNGTGKNFFN